MALQTKLLLVSCSGEETFQLAKKINQILRSDHGLEDQVEILHCKKRSQVPEDMPKAHRHHLVGDYFADGEVQVDIGANSLKDLIRGKHIALVEHFLTPNRKASEGSDQIVSVNDHLMTVRGFLDVVSNVDTLQKTLVTPYLAYVRSHSIEKYKKLGFYQFDSLRMMLKDLRKDGLDALLTIDPHSEKVAQITEELGMEFHGVNPFQSGRAIKPRKLGLAGEKVGKVIPKLRPFHERLTSLEKEFKGHTYFISVDDGAEHRTENFCERAHPEMNPETVYAQIAYLDKFRVSYEEAIVQFKPFSEINEKTIDKEGIYIILDDMIFTVGTASRAARIFKSLGVKRVEVWASHAVSMPSQHEKANNREYIDRIVCLDTIPQHPALDIEYIEASANLLAAELYKTHQKLVASR